MPMCPQSSLLIIIIIIIILYFYLAYHHRSWNHWVFHLFWAHLLNHALVKLPWGGICLVFFCLPNHGFTLSLCVCMLYDVVTKMHAWPMVTIEENRKFIHIANPNLGFTLLFAHIFPVSFHIGKGILLHKWLGH